MTSDQRQAGGFGRQNPRRTLGENGPVPETLWQRVARLEQQVAALIAQVSLLLLPAGPVPESPGPSVSEGDSQVSADVDSDAGPEAIEEGDAESPKEEPASRPDLADAASDAHAELAEPDGESSPVPTVTPEVRSRRRKS